MIRVSPKSKLHTLNSLLHKHFSKHYDLFVIGGGSGGLACARAAARLGAKVGLADHVTPSPTGTTWGLGGTCANVGCVPKKLIHKAALSFEELNELPKYGLVGSIEKKHNWNEMIRHVQNHIKKNNLGYRKSLDLTQVDFYDKLATLKDNHTIELNGISGNETVQSKQILISTGGRPAYLPIPGAKEHCITSDDIFSLPYAPGKTLIIGASYIAMECAGFLSGLGYESKVMVRSRVLRNFDQEMAIKLRESVERRGVAFIDRAVATQVIKDGKKLVVEYKDINTGILTKESFDTVLLAIGRRVDTAKLGVDALGIESMGGKIVVDDNEQTNVDNIYAIGDCTFGRMELTPVAIKAGKLLASRLFGNSKELLNYRNIATTVFTPLEYGSIGVSEETAISELGKERMKVYHASFKPVEWAFDEEREENSFMKVIVDTLQKEKVIGFHLLSPNAGEITQGISIAFNLGMKKADLDKTIGIHPTIAEVLR